MYLNTPFYINGQSAIKLRAHRFYSVSVAKLCQQNLSIRSIFATNLLTDYISKLLLYFCWRSADII